ncbi:MAG TPA: bifunctional 2-polyprenyl-6-hydroxyphenol methylase/3-demethylubiquinol 3-O-methyltransferase UbiG [Dongiaceae bacterium]|jgi:2-polyprenyl-6-hydroxyphenyl methylase/3-demethylubiquinone-9 3-methyltransferase|nr:bifunctional 2-polyprenyl-6-hydroxyphenol methylase/3-demethylubiquinol 3-O-methyltransferase UbiG [Dongiaceae bacterium]
MIRGSDHIPSGSADPREIEKFSALAETWWDQNGPMRPLHRLNPVRIAYIRDRIMRAHGRTNYSDRPLAGLDLLDVGCGGGLLSEPMARLGARVTGIDASERNIQIARLHAEQAGVPVIYRAGTLESMETDMLYDVILAMEIVEHIADLDVFFDALAARLKPGGLLFLATLNRTVRSFALAIVGAEYVLRWLPRGTHDWKKFLRPSEIVRYLRPRYLIFQEMSGIRYRPLADRWELSADCAVNYILVAKAPTQGSQGS